MPFNTLELDCTSHSGIRTVDPSSCHLWNV